MSFLDTVKEKMASYKMRILAVTTVSLMTLVQYSSAATLNESIGPILESVAELFVPLLALVIAAVPLIIAISVIGFVLGILSAILQKLHI
jgi:uncharacterized membrane protein (DUF106 family)